MARNLLIISSRLITTTNVPRLRKNTKIFNFINTTAATYFQILRNYSKITNLSPAPDVSYDDTRIETLSEFKHKYTPGLKFVTAKLQHLFDLPTTQIKDLLKKYPNLIKVSPKLITTNFSACSEAGISKEMMLQYPMVLAIENINYKLTFLKKINVDINLIVPLIFANFYELKQILQEALIEEGICPHGNRIVYMSHLLNIPIPEICEKIIHHVYVFRIPLERLENILKVLLDYGVEPRNILNDCWVLRYKPSLAEERLELAIHANIPKVKTWMIRCPSKVLQRCIDRQTENRKILGTNLDVNEYLSKRLECTLDHAKYLTEKCPAILKMNISKMKEILDFLYEQGYTPEHVCRVPRIMIHSKETTKLRIEQLKQMGYPPPSLASLCKSKRDFDKILKKYVKRKKNNEMDKVVTQK